MLTGVRQEQIDAAISDFDVHATRSTHGLIEVGATAATKGAAMQWLLNADRRPLIAFGDMDNDIELLRLANTSVAVANASPAVLNVARHISLSNSEDGVAVYLDQWRAAMP
jgi:hydroxymethylpyrimidine pyrophosphatase-like HAD family hydrolase